MTLEKANQPTWKNAEISINCRLVKDFSKVVHFKAACRQPQIRLSSKELIFNCELKMTDEKWRLSFSQDNNDLLSVFNLIADELECVVINDAVYFSVINADNSCWTESNIIESQSCLNLRIVPRLDLLLEHIDYLRKVSYIQS
jgi:BRCT domain type II-containing protein